MPRVTALRELPHGRVVVYLDGERWRVLPLEPVVSAGITVDAELDRPRVRTLRRALRRREALDRASRALKHRDLSTAALRARLERRGTPAAPREEAIEALARVGLVDDDRVARIRAESLAARGLGDAAIRWDLARQGIAEDLAQQAVAALESELARAARLVAVHGAGPRTARLLARRGFDAESIEAVCAAEAVPATDEIDVAGEGPTKIG